MTSSLYNVYFNTLWIKMILQNKKVKLINNENLHDAKNI